MNKEQFIDKWIKDLDYESKLEFVGDLTEVLIQALKEHNEDISKAISRAFKDRI